MKPEQKDPRWAWQLAKWGASGLGRVLGAQTNTYKERQKAKEAQGIAGVPSSARAGQGRKGTWRPAGSDCKEPYSEESNTCI